MTFNRIRNILIISAFAVAFTHCNYFTKKNTYSHLPADTANYLMWCDELKEDSTKADVLYKRGEYLFNKKLFLKALADVNNATSIDTTNSNYYFLLGEVCFAVNKTKIAALSYERAITLDKENVKAYLKLGRLYYIVKEHVKSLQNYDEAIKLQPECEECFFYKGLNFREMNKLTDHLDLAVAMFQKTLVINQNYFDAYIQLGELYDLKSPKIALEYYNAAIRMQPQSIEALYHRAYHYQMQHRYDSSGADYKRILEINPNFINGYFNIAFINMEQHQWQQAIEGFKLVTKMNVDNAGAWYNLGFCYENNNERKKAIQAYQECLLIDRIYPKAAERLQALK